eukprot:Em0015g1298a
MIVLIDFEMKAPRPSFPKRHSIAGDLVFVFDDPRAATPHSIVAEMVSLNASSLAVGRRSSSANESISIPSRTDAPSSAPPVEGVVRAQASSHQEEASPPPQDLEDGMELSPDARAPGQATLLPVHVSLSLSVGLAKLTPSNIIEGGRKRPAIKTYGEKRPYNKRQAVEAIDVVLTEASVTAGSAVLAAEQQKHNAMQRY